MHVGLLSATITKPAPDPVTKLRLPEPLNELILSGTNAQFAGIWRVVEIGRCYAPAVLYYFVTRTELEGTESSSLVAVVFTSR